MGQVGGVVLGAELVTSRVGAGLAVCWCHHARGSGVLDNEVVVGEQKRRGTRHRRRHLPAGRTEAEDQVGIVHRQAHADGLDAVVIGGHRACRRPGGRGRPRRQGSPEEDRSFVPATGKGCRRSGCWGRRSPGRALQAAVEGWGTLLWTLARRAAVLPRRNPAAARRARPSRTPSLRARNRSQPARRCSRRTAASVTAPTPRATARWRRKARTPPTSPTTNGTADQPTARSSSVTSNGAGPKFDMKGYKSKMTETGDLECREFSSGALQAK